MTAERSPLAAEIRATVAVAAPLAVANLAQMAIALTNTLMVGHLGAVPLAATGLGGALYFMLVMLCQGVLAAVAPLGGDADRGGGGAAGGARDRRRRSPDRRASRGLRVGRGGNVGRAGHRDADGPSLAARSPRLRSRTGSRDRALSADDPLGCARLSRRRRAALPAGRDVPHAHRHVGSVAGDPGQRPVELDADLRPSWNAGVGQRRLRLRQRDRAVADAV